MDKKTVYFSCRRVLRRALVFGIGYGYHGALIIQLGQHVVMLGPHYWVEPAK